MPLTIHAGCYSTTIWDAELPEGRTWDDVKSASVKWDTLHISWKDGTESSIEMLYVSENSDTKRPISLSIWDDDEDEEIVSVEGNYWEAGEV